MLPQKLICSFKGILYLHKNMFLQRSEMLTVDLALLLLFFLLFFISNNRPKIKIFTQ
jgi:hypothetical protein